jgi:hypothetical protein
MSATSALAITMLIWALIGVRTSISMGRRGYDRFTWWLLGTVLGPLVLPLAIVTVVESPLRDAATPAAEPEAEAGPYRQAERRGRPPR